MSEIELLLHLKNSVDVLSYLQEQSYVHGHISPDSIYVSADGQIKIADSTLLGTLRLPSLMRVHDDLLGSYKAPELIEDPEYMDRLMPNKIYKNDVFALGMTFLELATLEDMHACYKDPKKFDYQHLQKVYKKAQKMYPKNFCNVIKYMIQGSETYRPDLVELRKNFFTYAEDDEPFEILDKYPHHKRTASNNTSSVGIKKSSEPIKSQFVPKPMNHEIITTPTKKAPSNTFAYKTSQPNSTSKNGTDIKSTTNTTTKKRIFSPEK